jgi:signal transduction histidine kinase
VLVLYQQLAETQPMRAFEQRFRQTVQQELGSPVEFYQEALDFDRFTGREHSSPLAAYFADKYRGFGIAVVVPVGGRALSFAVNQLRDLLPNVPMVFALCALPQTNPASQPANVTGRIASASRFAPTLWMARGLQPDAKRVVVVGGAGAADSVSVSAAASSVATLGDSLPLTIVQGLSLDALLPRLRDLPRNSIVIFANYRQDGHGQAFEPLDVVGSIARAAAGPMYTQLRSYVGEGVVGGSVTRFDDEGVRTGRLVIRVLRRRPGERMPPVESIANSYVADWRQLQRWGLSEKRLPPGTDLVFREQTLWQRYRTVILLTLVVTSAELLLIANLLLERGRRKRAQLVAEEQLRRLEETRRQVADMGRLATIGELAATISHELRQPLAAIRANAETGAKFVTRNAGQFGTQDRQLCGEIFNEIVADNALAADIITRVRALVRGEELPWRLVDVNEICRTSVRLLQHDTRARHAEIILSLDPQSPAVVGDPVQLQQVLLNLLWNALDAAAASTNPKIVISSLDRGEEVELAVLDNGPGLPPDVQQHLFESFFTTKPQGLGLGLVIVQSIVERHQGRVRADNDERGGAVFRVVLPRTRSTPIRLSEADLTRVGTETSTSK